MGSGGPNMEIGNDNVAQWDGDNGNISKRPT